MNIKLISCILSLLYSVQLLASEEVEQSLFFPEGLFYPSSERADHLVNDWYSNQLTAMDEVVIISDGITTTYRFLWLRTFHHPVSVRVSSTNQEAILVAVELDGAGGYDPGKVLRNLEIELSISQFLEIEKFIQENGFWELETSIERQGMDGSEWIVEGAAVEYHVVSRWTPTSGSIRLIGEYLLNLTNWQYNDSETY